MGMLYGANTGGAVFGCLLAGFYLLRVFDMAHRDLCRRRAERRGRPGQPCSIAGQPPSRSRSRAAAAIAKRAPTGRSTSPSRSPAPRRSAPKSIWTRLLGLMLGATVYTFSIILGVFLIGLGIGSAAGSAMARNLRTTRPRAALRRLPASADARRSRGPRSWSPSRCRTGPSTRCFRPAPGTPSRSTWSAASGPSCRRPFSGARAFRWRSPPPREATRTPARLVGGIYAANTGGAILGALSFSLLLVPWIGTQGAERLLIALAAVSAVAHPGAGRRGRRAACIGAAGLAAGAACLPAAGVAMSTGVPGMLIAYGRRIMTSMNRSEDPVHGRRHQLLDRHLAVGGRRRPVPRQRQSRGIDRALRHAAAAHARPHARRCSIPIRNRC